MVFGWFGSVPEESVPRPLTSVGPVSQPQTLPHVGAWSVVLNVASAGVQTGLVVKLRVVLLELAPQTSAARTRQKYVVALDRPGLTVQLLAVRPVPVRTMLVKFESLATSTT